MSLPWTNDESERIIAGKSGDCQTHQTQLGPLSASLNTISFTHWINFIQIISAFLGHPPTPVLNCHPLIRPLVPWHFCLAHRGLSCVADLVLSIPRKVTRSLRWHFKRHLASVHSERPPPSLPVHLKPTLTWRTGQLTRLRVRSPRSIVSPLPVLLAPIHMLSLVAVSSKST